MLYKAARNIYDLGRREISIRGKILDLATSVPLTGAKVELLETGKRLITAQTGGYRFKSLQSEVYSISVTKKLYKNQLIQNIPVVEGKLHHHDIFLERINH